ncbi:MAG: hypothetical protein ACR2RB_06155 [Gammaproteobacteria bacterium]
MEKFLRGDGEGMELLREQYADAELREIEESGVGIFFTYNVTTKKKFKNNFELGDVGVKVDGFEDEIGAIIFVRDGVLEMLELHSYSDEWPSIIDKICVYYLNDKRDLTLINSAV